MVGKRLLKDAGWVKCRLVIAHDSGELTVQNNVAMYDREQSI